MLKQCPAKCNASNAQGQKFNVQKLFFRGRLERHITGSIDLKGGNNYEYRYSKFSNRK
jgi:hypothetical protein